MAGSFVRQVLSWDASRRAAFTPVVKFARAHVVERINPVVEQEFQEGWGKGILFRAFLSQRCGDTSPNHVFTFWSDSPGIATCRLPPPVPGEGRGRGWPSWVERATSKENRADCCRRETGTKDTKDTAERELGATDKRKTATQMD